MNEERPIEKLLRRHAQQRRDEAGPPPELHPATRRLLQGEVARQFPKARPTRGLAFGALLRARWVYAAACLVVVGGGAVLVRSFLLPEPGVASLAAKDKELFFAEAVAPEPTSAREASPKRDVERLADATSAAPPPAAPTRVLKKATSLRTESAAASSNDERVATRPAEVPPVARTVGAPAGERFKATRATPTVAADRANEHLASRAPAQSPASLAAPTLAESKSAPVGSAKDFGTSETAQDVSVTVQPTAAPPPGRVNTGVPASDSRARNASLARGGGLELETRAALSQAYANIAGSAEVDKAKAASGAAVLMNFRVEQTGNELRVIDGDGSTYLGVTPNAATEAASPLDAKKEAAAYAQTRRAQPGAYARQAGEAQVAGKYLYAVRGTNVTLQQAVSFAWNFVSPSNVPGVSNQGIGGIIQAAPQEPWANSTINGQVQLNTGRQFELNAAPVK